MNSYKKLGKNSLMVFFGNFGSKVIVFLMLPFYTKYLTPENYGNLDIITTVMTLLIPLVTLAISEAAFRLPKNQNNEVQREYFTTGLVTSLMGVFLFGVLYLVFFKFIGGIFRNYALAFYLILLSTHIATYLQQFTRSLDRIDVYATTGIIYTFFFTVLNIIFVRKYGFNGYLASMLITQIIVILYLVFRINFYEYFNFKKISKRRLKETLEYTTPLIPTATVWWIMNLSDRLILKHYYGGESVGFYAVASKFPMIIATVFGIFQISWQIGAIDEYRKESFKIFYNNLFQTISVILNIVSIGLMLSILPIMKILVSNIYFDSWKLVPILSIGVMYSSLATFIGVNYIAFKKTKGALYTACFGALVNIVLNFILIPKYSVLGACISTMIAYIVLFIFRKIQVDKMVKLDIKFSKIIFEIGINIGVYMVILSKKSWTYKGILVLILMGFYIYINIKYIKRVIDIINKKVVLKFLKNN